MVQRRAKNFDAHIDLAVRGWFSSSSFLRSGSVFVSKFGIAAAAWHTTTHGIMIVHNGRNDAVMLATTFVPLGSQVSSLHVSFRSCLS